MGAATRRRRRAAPALLGLLLLGGCGGPPTVDNAAAVADIREGHGAEVTVEGHVARLLVDGNGPAGPHQRFSVDIGSGVAVEIDHNLTLAARVPLHLGDDVIVHGLLAPDPGRAVIHETHHSTGGHEGGFVELAGQRYE